MGGGGAKGEGGGEEGEQGYKGNKIEKNNNGTMMKRLGKKKMI